MSNDCLQTPTLTINLIALSLDFVKLIRNLVQHCQRQRLALIVPRNLQVTFELFCLGQ